MGGSMNVRKYTIKDYNYWKMISGLAIASFFIFATMYSVQPILPLFTKNYEISISVASLSMSLSTVGLIFGLILIGFISDRYGRLLFIHLSILITTIILFIIPFMESFIFIIILRFIQGFSLAGLLGSALGYMVEEIDKKYFGFAATLYISSNSIGGMMGRFITGYLAESFSWQTAMFVLGAIGVFSYFLVLFTLPKSRYFQKSQVRFQEDIAGFLYHLKNPSLLLMFGLGIVLQLSFTGMWTYLPFYLLESPYELTLKQISYLYFAYSLGVVGAPIAGWLTGKYNMRNIRIVGIIILTAGMLITLFHSFILITIGLCVICLGFFISHSLATASVSQEATHHKGSASSLYLVAYYIGVSMGTTLLAPLWEKFGWNGIILVTGLLPLIYVMIIQVTRGKLKSKQAS